MERARVAAHNAQRAAQKFQQWPELTVIQEWVRLATRSAHGSRQFVLSRTVVHDAAQTQSAANFPAERPESLRRPTLRTPATTWAQDNVAINACLRQKLGGGRVVRTRRTQTKRRHAIPRSRAQRKLPVLVRDMSGGGADSIGIKKRHAEFAYGSGRKPNPPLHSPQERQCRRLP